MHTIIFQNLLKLKMQIDAKTKNPNKRHTGIVENVMYIYV